MPIAVTRSILRPVCITHGKEADANQPLPVSVRLLASAVGLTIMCERLNDRNLSMDEIAMKLSSAMRLAPRDLEEGAAQFGPPLVAE